MSQKNKKKKNPSKTFNPLESLASKITPESDIKVTKIKKIITN